MGYGDSKTSANIYQPLLQADLITATPTRTIHYTNIAAGGRIASTGAAAIDAELAASNANPDYILFNLGVSDLDALPAEATWKADIQYILSAMNVKWAAAKIYLMRPWKANYMTEANTMAGWIADLITTNDYCYQGPDERVFLEGGDNGATYTSDGTHPTNPTGYQLTANQWRTVVGF